MEKKQDMSNELIKVLREGGVGVAPTDTLYGIVASALNKNSVERVYALKGRQENKPCIILLSDVSEIRLFIPEFLESREIERSILDVLWPGSVSVVLPCDREEVEYLHRTKKTLAFRVSADERVGELIAKVGPLIAPSANPEGAKPAGSVSAARAYFGNQVNWYEDGGELSGEPSTVVDLCNISSGEVRVVREGVVSTDEIRKKLQSVGLGNFRVSYVGG